jgi:heme exporter protein A
MLLHADNLSIERGTRTVIASLSFTAKAGEALLLVGPNGAGKTTLIRALAGFISPSSGTISLAGDADKVEFADRTISELCHYVGHLTGIKSSLTAEQNLAFWAEYLGGDEASPIADRVETALSDFGLSALADYPAGLLSAGQKRRLGLARLSVAARPIWLLDEPTVSLDAASTELLARLIQTHLAEGGLVIAATHLPLGLEAPVYLRLGPSSDDTATGARP